MLSAQFPRRLTCYYLWLRLFGHGRVFGFPPRQPRAGFRRGCFTCVAPIFCLPPLTFSIKTSAAALATRKNQPLTLCWIGRKSNAKQVYVRDWLHFWVMFWYIQFQCSLAEEFGMTHPHTDRAFVAKNAHETSKTHSFSLLSCPRFASPTISDTDVSLLLPDETHFKPLWAHCATHAECHPRICRP